MNNIEEVTFTKRKLRKLFREIILSSQKMSNLPYEDKHYPEEDDRRYRMFIEDDALEYIMRIYTDRLFDGKSNNKKHYENIFGKNILTK